MRDIQLMAVGLLLVSLGCSLSVNAQQGIGSLKGVVKDQSGGIMVGAPVVALHEATGVETKVMTNDAGAYSFPALNVGVYTLNVSSQGFKTARRPNIRIVSGESLIVDFELLVGEISETTTITTELQTTDTTSSSAATTRTVEEISDLPLQLKGAERNSLSFLRTLSAVNPQVHPFESTVVGLAIIQGVGDGLNHGSFTSYTIDGVNASSSMFQGLGDEAPPVPDAVEEFRLATNVNAEIGGNMGTGVELVTKSGTNALHGSAFWYVRNDALDARNFFASSVAPQKQNEFGFVLGGPIRKNKTFFFGSYDGYRFRSSPAGGVRTVPTVKMRTGDFTEILGPQIGTDTLGRPVFRGQVFDPKTTRADGRGGFVRDPFPGNVIPAERFSPISRFFQNAYPLPNLPGRDLNWVGLNTPSPVDLDKMTVKVDHSMGNHKLTFGLEGLLRKNNILGNIGFAPEVVDIINFDTEQYRIRIIDNWVIRPNIVFSLRTGATILPRNIDNTKLPGAEYGAKAGLRGTYTPNTPNVRIAGFTGFGGVWYQNISYKQVIPVNMDLSIAKGNHNIKFGAEMIHQITSARSSNSTNGIFDFSDRTTNMPNNLQTGSGYASFLLGEVNNAVLSSPQIARYTSRGWAFYLQDEWRIRGKLTLNYGLRYDLSEPPVELHDRIASFDPQVPNPAAGNRLGALTFWGTGPGRNGRTSAIDTYYRAFGPRVGISYAPDSRTVVRSYYGIVYSPVYSDLAAGSSAPYYGWGATLNPTSLDGGVTPAFNWNDGFPTKPGLPNLDPSLLNGSSVLLVGPQESRPAMVQNLGFGIERELPGAIALRADYVGKLSHGVRRFGGFGGVRTGTLSGLPLNQIDIRYLSLGDLLNANINSPSAQAAGIAIPYPGFSGTVAQALRPYPQYIGVEDINEKSGYGLFHAMELTAQRRFSKGYFFLVSYTVSKNLLSGRFQHLMFDSARSKGINTLDRAQTLTFSYGYDLPFGPGRSFLSNSNPFLRELVGGWRIVATHTYAGGRPVEVSSRAFIPGVGAVWPLRVPGVPVSTGVTCGTYDPGDPTRNRMMNINAFQTPTPYTFGNTQNLPDFRSCGVVDESISILKDTSIRENIKLQFGVDLFNAFNRHAWVSSAAGVAGPVGDIDNPAAFGRWTGASDPRTIQFHLKVKF